MTTQQIGMRLQHENVEHLDAEVAAGHAKSRAAYVDRLLARDRRRKQSLEDLKKIANAGPDPDMDALLAYTSAHPVDMSDLD